MWRRRKDEQENVPPLSAGALDELISPYVVKQSPYRLDEGLRGVSCSGCGRLLVLGGDEQVPERCAWCAQLERADAVEAEVS